MCTVVSCNNGFFPFSLFQNSTKVHTWEGNKAVAELIAEKSRPIVKRFTVPVPGGFEAQVKLHLPPDADMSGKTKYPMLVYV